MHDLLKAYRRQYPGRIPVTVDVDDTCWAYYDREELLSVIKKHPGIFPNYQGYVEYSKHPYFMPWKRKGVAYTDSWGCEWMAEHDGWTGIVQKPSLDTWDKLDSFVPPSAENQNGWGPQDWDRFAENAKRNKARGLPVSGSLRHGHCFLTLTYMRGFENLIYDMADEDPRLDRLIRMIQDFDVAYVNKILEHDEVDMVCYPEDLGTQTNSMISPEMFRKYIKPVYIAAMKPAIDKGKLIHMHSDGYIMNLIDDLIDCGIDIINLQDLVNGIDNIASEIKGRLSINLDIDRQTVIPRGTPQDIDDLIREEVEKLYSPDGGLTLLHYIEPPTPPKNIDAVLTALEKYRTYKK